MTNHIEVSTLLLTLDLAGTAVFAISGAAVGVKHRLDVFGVCAGVRRGQCGRNAPRCLDRGGPAGCNCGVAACDRLASGWTDLFLLAPAAGTPPHADPDVRCWRPGIVCCGRYAEGAGVRTESVDRGATRNVDRYRRRVGS